MRKNASQIIKEANKLFNDDFTIDISSNIYKLLFKDKKGYLLKGKNNTYFYDFNTNIYEIQK